MASKALARSEYRFQAVPPEWDVVVTTYSHVIWLQGDAMSQFKNSEIARVARFLFLHGTYQNNGRWLDDFWWLLQPTQI